MLAERRNRPELRWARGEVEGGRIVALHSDLWMIEKDMLATVRELRVARQVRGVLHHACSDAGCLQAVHDVLRPLLRGPSVDQGVQLVAMFDAIQHRREAR